MTGKLAAALLVLLVLASPVAAKDKDSLTASEKKFLKGLVAGLSSESRSSTNVVSN